MGKVAAVGRVHRTAGGATAGGGPSVAFSIANFIRLRTKEGCRGGGRRDRAVTGGCEGGSSSAYMILNSQLIEFYPAKKVCPCTRSP